MAIVNKAATMREIAFLNKDVQKLYKETIAEIEKTAKEGDLYCIIDNDETVRELLIKDGFSVMTLPDKSYPDTSSYLKVKVSW